MIMMIVLFIGAAWLLASVLVVALCVSAARGDRTRVEAGEHVVGHRVRSRRRSAGSAPRLRVVSGAR